MKTIPPALLSWLTYQSSLTERLKAIAGDARLDILGQRWESPDVFDEQVLQLDSHRVLHREILTWAWDEPYWYARTIIPSTTYDVDPLFFGRLKTESLGHLIFNENRIKRDDLEHYTIDKEAIEYQWLTPVMYAQTETLWVRKSQFRLDSVPFFLIEILLPALMRAIT